MKLRGLSIVDMFLQCSKVIILVESLDSSVLSCVFFRPATKKTVIITSTRMYVFDPVLVRGRTGPHACLLRCPEYWRRSVGVSRISEVSWHLPHDPVRGVPFLRSGVKDRLGSPLISYLCCILTKL